jgi:putative transposase
MWTGLYYRRHMPHFQNGGHVYLLTFVTHQRWTLPPKARYLVLKEIVSLHHQRAFVHTAVVMPDHVHAVLQPIEIALSEILRLIKGRSARAINVALHRSGAVWQQESHDYQIRGEESLIKKCEYVAENPVRKGLCASPDEWPWLFRWWIDGTG